MSVRDVEPTSSGTLFDKHVSTFGAVDDQQVARDDASASAPIRPDFDDRQTLGSAKLTGAHQLPVSSHAGSPLMSVVSSTARDSEPEVEVAADENGRQSFGDQDPVDNSAIFMWPFGAAVLLAIGVVVALSILARVATDRSKRRGVRVPTNDIDVDMDEPTNDMDGCGIMVIDSHNEFDFDVDNPDDALELDANFGSSQSHAVTRI